MIAAVSLVGAASAQSLRATPPTSPLPVDVYSKDAEGRVVIRASRTTRPLVIDGRIDDIAYREVASFEGFIQADPDEGAPATERTQVWVMFDDTNL